MSKELLFSVTKDDCDWSYTRGTGKGGQKKNKTSSAVHCSHEPSGAHGYAEDSRSQHENKHLAFSRMVATKKFQTWLQLEIARRNGTLLRVNEAVENQMKQIKVEIKEEGKWKEVDKNAPLSEEINAA